MRDGVITSERFLSFLEDPVSTMLWTVCIVSVCLMYYIFIGFAAQWQEISSLRRQHQQTFRNNTASGLLQLFHGILADDRLLQ